MAGGMSGSPVYIDGKLVGAVALRISVFSPDSICGITPIESMLEKFRILTGSRPAEPLPGTEIAEIPKDLVQRLVSAGVSEASLPHGTPLLEPIATPMVFSGFSGSALRTFEPLLQQMGVTAVQTGGGGSGDHGQLEAGQGVGILAQPRRLSRWNPDLRRSFRYRYGHGHLQRRQARARVWPSFMNLGPVDMPMAKGEVVMTLASSSTVAQQAPQHDRGGGRSAAGSLQRHHGRAGSRSADGSGAPEASLAGWCEQRVTKEKDFNFQVFVHQKYTPTLMMVTLASTIQQINEYADEITYRVSGNVDVLGGGSMHVATIFTGSEAPAPPPLMLANWWGDKFNRLFANPVSMPKLTKVDCTIDLLPERRIAAIDSAWTPSTQIEAGSEIPVKECSQQPYRGERLERSLTVKIPAGLAKGEHRILFSDADTLNRLQSIGAASSRFMDVPETVSLLNQERSNNRMYVSLVGASRHLLFTDDKTFAFTAPHPCSTCWKPITRPAAASPVLRKPLKSSSRCRLTKWSAEAIRFALQLNKRRQVREASQSRRSSKSSHEKNSSCLRPRERVSRDRFSG